MLKAGTLVVCPSCALPQLESTKDLRGSQQLKEAAWKSLGYDMENSIRMACYKCQTLWYRKHPVTKKSQLFTKDNGWISLEFEKPKEKTKPLIITGPSTLQ